MNNPYTISVQYNAAKCGWTVICNDPDDNLVGVRYSGTMDAAITFAHDQCFKIVDFGYSSALTVFDRNGRRSYSVSPESFARAWQRDVDQQVAKDFSMVAARIAA